MINTETMSSLIQRPTRFWAGGFLFDPTSEFVFLHLRDGNTTINPNKWAFFGGLSEGDESPLDCYRREIREEIGISVECEKVILLREYLNVELNTQRIVFYSLADSTQNDFVLGEGAGFGWIHLRELSAYDLTEKTKEDLEFLVVRITK